MLLDRLTRDLDAAAGTISSIGPVRARLEQVIGEQPRQRAATSARATLRASATSYCSSGWSTPRGSRSPRRPASDRPPRRFRRADRRPGTRASRGREAARRSRRSTAEDWHQVRIDAEAASLRLRGGRARCSAVRAQRLAKNADRRCRTSLGEHQDAVIAARPAARHGHRTRRRHHSLHPRTAARPPERGGRGRPRRVPAAVESSNAREVLRWLGE